MKNDDVFLAFLINLVIVLLISIPAITLTAQSLASINIRPLVNRAYVRNQKTSRKQHTVEESI